jgi:hypothetical protein
MRASAAPRQACTPLPKLRCSRALVRVVSKIPGCSKTAGSRLAPPNRRNIASPARTDAAQANLDDVNAKWDKRDTARRMLQINDEQIAAIRKQIRDAREALWGIRPELDAMEPESDE